MAFNRLVEISSGPPGGFGKVVTNLRMTFEVTKTDQKSPNTAKAEIYNCTENTASIMGVVGNNLIIRAGYEDEGGLKSLFFGKITRSIYKTNGTDKILELEAMDGRADLTTTILSIGLAGDTPVQTVVNEILKTFTIPLATPLTLPFKLYKQGYSFIGKAKDALTEALRYVNYSWTVINEQLYIFQSGQSLIRSGLRLTPESGLLTTPEKLSDTGKKAAQTQLPNAWKIKCLLFPQLSPGADFKVESSVLTGTLKVVSSTFSGDNYEGDFTTEMEAVSL